MYMFKAANREHLYKYMGATKPEEGIKLFALLLKDGIFQKIIFFQETPPPP